MKAIEVQRIYNQGPINVGNGISLTLTPFFIVPFKNVKFYIKLTIQMTNGTTADVFGFYIFLACKGANLTSKGFDNYKLQSGANGKELISLSILVAGFDWDTVFCYMDFNPRGSSSTDFVVNSIEGKVYMLL